jgi:hypothetical protein
MQFYVLLLQDGDTDHDMYMYVLVRWPQFDSSHQPLYKATWAQLFRSRAGSVHHLLSGIPTMLTVRCKSKMQDSSCLAHASLELHKHSLLLR